jgi:hypothetical protein
LNFIGVEVSSLVSGHLNDDHPLTEKERTMKLNRLTRKTSIFVAALVLALFCVGAALAAAGYSLFGDAQLVSPGYNSNTAAQIRSDVTIPPNYGGVNFNVPAGLTVAGLNNLSSDYKFTAGSCGLGSPRFQVNVTTPSNGTKNIQVYFGPPPSYTLCPAGIWSNTGNLAAPTNLVDATQLGGGFYEPYAAVQAVYGNYPVTGIQVVVDSGYAVGGTQTALVDNIVINNAIFTFDTTQCKDSGWQNVTRVDGSPFKNQGDCIQYFNTGK